MAITVDTLLHDGKRSMKVSQWAKELGISNSDMMTRACKYYHSKDHSIRMKTFAPKPMLEWDGKIQSIEDWAKELRISVASMNYRINAHYDNPKTRHKVFAR